MFPKRVFQTASLFSVLLLAAVSSPASDEPDLKKEQRLHQIYEQYNSTPTKEEAWAGVVNGKTQTYSIQQGDTLWDLSSALFGDSQFWPKVWSINSDKIQNPHEIFPGLTVHFTPGTTGEAPSLAVKPTEEAPAPEAKSEEVIPEQEVANQPPVSPADANFQQQVLSRAEIPPEAPTPPPTKIPKSIPFWTYNTPRGAKLKLEVKKINRNFGNPEQPLASFVADQKAEGIGVVSETEMNQTVASDFQYIYVKLSQGASGDTVYAFKETGEIKDPISGAKGQLVQVQGEIEVLEKVNSSENLYRAMVKKSINPVEVGAKLMAGPMPRYNSQDQGGGSGNAHVVGGQFSTNRKMVESQSLVFLNGQGLAVGQTYPIYKRQSTRNPKTHVIENPRQIGRVKVLKVSDSFATGVVLNSLEEIQVGDVTSPQMVNQ